MNTLTFEEKVALLTKDLSGRLPYKVIIYRGEKDYIGEDDALLEGIDIISGICKLRCLPEGTVFVQDHVSNILPYLRPMSSMTEEEVNEYNELCGCNAPYPGIIENEVAKFMDWLNEHHFDYHGLIEKGLALEAPEGMYK